MGYLRRPSYYRQFRCIGSDCTDNCCIGWEIDIDPETLASYQRTSGAFGQRLRDSIALSPPDSEENPHFILDSAERCPFLNDKNLCDIFIHLGESHLCQICTDHPRFYTWLSDGREEGIGLCCEAAARLILQPTGFPQWEVIQTASEPENMSEEPDPLEQALLAMRDELFHLIKPDIAVPLDSKFNQLYCAASDMQERYDAILFPFPEDNTEAGSTLPDWSACFWQEDFLRKLLDGCLQLEINDPGWRDLLTAVRQSLPEICQRRPDFLQYYASRQYEYDQLLLYFIYRHMMKALEDDCLLEKIQFALYSVSLIQLLDIFCWLRDGTLTTWQQICLCKLYSKEMEYDTDNTAFLEQYPIMAE